MLIEEQRRRVQLPTEFRCEMCNDVLREAVLISCCGTSYCDECIRQRLIG